MGIQFLLPEGPPGSVDQECFGPLLALFDLLKADGIFVSSRSRLRDKPSNLHPFKVSVEVTEELPCMEAAH